MTTRIDVVVTMATPTTAIIAITIRGRGATKVIASAAAVVTVAAIMATTTRATDTTAWVAVTVAVMVI